MQIQAVPLHTTSCSLNHLVFIYSKVKEQHFQPCCDAYFDVSQCHIKDLLVLYHFPVMRGGNAGQKGIDLVH